MITDNTVDKLTLSKNESTAVTVPVIERSHESAAGEVSALWATWVTQHYLPTTTRYTAHHYFSQLHTPWYFSYIYLLFGFEKNRLIINKTRWLQAIITSKSRCHAVELYASAITLMTKGPLHTLNQMVNQAVNHLVSCWRVAGNPNPQLKLT